MRKEYVLINTEQHRINYFLFETIHNKTNIEGHDCEMSFASAIIFDVYRCPVKGEPEE